MSSLIPCQALINFHGNVAFGLMKVQLSYWLYWDQIRPCGGPCSGSWNFGDPRRHYSPGTSAVSMLGRADRKVQKETPKPFTSQNLSSNTLALLRTQRYEHSDTFQASVAQWFKTQPQNPRKAQNGVEDETGLAAELFVNSVNRDNNIRSNNSNHNIMIRRR